MKLTTLYKNNPKNNKKFNRKKNTEILNSEKTIINKKNLKLWHVIK